MMLPMILLIVVNKLFIVGLAAVTNFCEAMDGFLVTVLFVVDLTKPVLIPLEVLLITLGWVILEAELVVTLGRGLFTVEVNEFLTVPVFKNGLVGFNVLAEFDLAVAICLGDL